MKRGLEKGKRKTKVERECFDDAIDKMGMMKYQQNLRI